MFHCDLSLLYGWNFPAMLDDGNDGHPMGFLVIFLQDNGRPCLGNWNETKPNAEPGEVDCVLEETPEEIGGDFSWPGLKNGGVIWGFPEMGVPQ